MSKHRCLWLTRVMSKHRCLWLTRVMSKHRCLWLTRVMSKHRCLWLTRVMSKHRCLWLTGVISLVKRSLTSLIIIKLTVICRETLISSHLFLVWAIWESLILWPWNKSLIIGHRPTCCYIAIQFALIIVHWTTSCYIWNAIAVWYGPNVVYTFKT